MNHFFFCDEVPKTALLKSPQNSAKTPHKTPKGFLNPPLKPQMCIFFHFSFSFCPLPLGLLCCQPVHLFSLSQSEASISPLKPFSGKKKEKKTFLWASSNASCPFLLSFNSLSSSLDFSSFFRTQ